MQRMDDQVVLYSMRTLYVLCTYLLFLRSFSLQRDPCFVSRTETSYELFDSPNVTILLPLRYFSLDYRYVSCLCFRFL